MTGRLIKKFLVITNLDIPVAYLAAKLQFSVIQRLVPGPTYYTRQKRKVSRKGIKFILQPSDISQWLIFSGRYDTHVQAAIDHMSPDKPLILDVGANIGHFSLILAGHLQRKGYDKKIIAFEPNPKVHQLLEKNLRCNPRLKNFVELYAFAVGDKAVTMRFSVPRSNSGAGTLTSTYHHVKHDDFFVKIITLDEFINQPVGFIKIDVEGFEYRVLAGAHEIIKKYRPVIYVETHPAHENYFEIFSFLKDLGYTLFNEDGRALEIASITGLVNALAVYKSE